MPISIGFSTMPSIFTVHGRIGSFCAWSETSFDELNS